MVRIGILDVTGCQLSEFKIGERLPMAEKERIEKTKNPGEKLLRCAAYTLLGKMYTETFLCERMPEMIYTPQGKPRFVENKSCHFNISHDGKAVAVAISDGEVGVDLQSYLVDDGTKSRVITRFENAIRVLGERGDSAPVVTFAFYEVIEGEISRKTDGWEINPLAKKDTLSDFCAEWTLLEAALKLDGGGFASIGYLEDIVRCARFLTVKFSLHGEEYALAVATKT